MVFFSVFDQKKPKTITNHNINKKNKKIKTNKQTNINMKIINKKKISKKQRQQKRISTNKKIHKLQYKT